MDPLDGLCVRLRRREELLLLFQGWWTVRPLVGVFQRVSVSPNAHDRAAINRPVHTVVNEMVNGARGVQEASKQC